MWRRVGGAVACTLCWLLACGRAERHPSDSVEDAAGSSTGGVTSAGTASTNNAGKAGAATSAGGAVALGGRPASAGNASGGEAEAGISASATGGEPSEGGQPGEGGATSCDGPYRACGCGCCAGQAMPSPICVYPTAGGDLAGFIAADKAASQSPLCASAGCSIGLDYVCCEAPPAIADQAKYVASLEIDGGLKRLELWKVTEVCTNLVLVQPSSPPAGLPLQTPPGWAPELARSRHVPCSASSLGPKAIGAIGKLGLRVLGDACVFDAHLTLFFGNSAQDVQAERFDIDAQPLNLSAAECY